MRFAHVVIVACACGRVGFDARISGVGGGDGNGGDGASGAVQWVKTFVAQGASIGGFTDSFVSAATAGDAVVLQVFCASTTAPSAVTLTAPGWTFAQLGAITGSTSSGYWGTAFGAIAPDNASQTFFIAWTVAQECTFADELGDEFTGVDPTGGTTTFEAAANLVASGDCTTSVTTRHAGDAVWAACTVNTITAPGAGFTKSADDGNGDGSEYKLTSDPANTVEAVGFMTATGMNGYLVSAVAIKPR